MNFYKLTLLNLLFLLCISLFCNPAAGSDDATEIRRVSFASRSDGGGIVIRLHATSPVHAYSEPRQTDDTHLELIVFNAELAEAHKFDSPHNPVNDFTVESRKGHLVFSFTLTDQISIKSAAYPDQGSDDILIGITLLEEATSSPAVIQPVADSATSLPEVEPEEEKKEPRKRKARKRDRTKDSTPVLAASDVTGEKWILDTVVIDAGHGGHDPGAVANGVKEKDINLQVALKVGYYLESILKVNVVYTRTDDRFVELQERGHIANEAGAKLFISIHANSAPYSRKVHGTETYILGLHRSDKAREVMERENGVVSLEENPNQYMDFDQNNTILQTLALSANLRLSEKLATHIEKQFAERARRNSRGVKQAGLIVLWAASMPAVLVELGYLTNRFEANYLQSEQGQDYLASAIFRAVRDYKYEYEKGLELSASH